MNDIQEESSEEEFFDKEGGSLFSKWNHKYTLFT